MTRLDKAAQSLGYADWEELKVKPHPDVERAQALAALTRAEQCLAEVYETIGMPLTAQQVCNGAEDTKAALAVIDRYLAQRDDDGWIEWGGGKCPVPVETLVWVKFRNGVVSTSAGTAYVFRWSHGTGCDSVDIIAYKVD